MSDVETIAAIATPPGRGGVGVIRISGPAAPRIADRVWRGATRAADFESHQLYYGEIIDRGEAAPSDQREREGEAPQAGLVEGATRAPIIDRALVVWMKAPHSYTGEDVVEIQAHGGPRLMEQILQLVLKNGARLARPGEFTERAFLSGRIDLTEAEAIADLISSESDAGLELAREQLSGHLRDEVTRLRQELVVMRSQVEAMIDFPEDEDVNVLQYDEVTERCDRVMKEISRWLASYEEGRLRRDGIRVVLAGRPNVGKSSLLNALLGEDRVIVHNEAGTTRDVVEAALQLNGILVRLSDTAGLHEGQGTVESEGIRRSLKQVSECDLVCFVIDGTEPLGNSDRTAYGQIKAKPHLIIENKADMPLFNPDHVLDEAFPEAKRLTTSAETGEGIDVLKATIFETALPHGRSSSDLYIANLRHKVCLEKTLETLKLVQKSAQAKAGLELLAADLLVAANHLGEITGEITHDEILTEIFSRFCLGK